MRTSLGALLISALLSAPVAAGERLTLLAEDNYPANYMDHGELKGLSVDLLRESLKRAGVDYTMAVVPWARAYDAALRMPDTCVFSTAHTAEREALFAWIEPLNTIEMVVVAPRDRAISITSDEDLRKYTIGTYLGDYRESVLKSMKMRIESVADDALNAEKLRRGRIDLWATDSARLPKLAGEFAPAYTFFKVNLALACNPGTDAATVERIRRALDGVHEDGTFARALAGYAAN